MSDVEDGLSRRPVASREFNPQKSRVLLRLALTKTQDTKRLRKFFLGD